MAITTEHRDGVALLTFQDAARMNSFDADTLAQIRRAFQAAMDDPAIKAIVLTGQGKAFSAGADVSRFHQSAKDGTSVEFVLAATAQLHPLMMALHTCDKPFVAAVNGVAAGGGLGLALAADLRIGSPAARFAAGYFGIGVSPDGGSTWFLPRLIGTQRARRFFFDNEVMDADEALATGLLDQVVDQDDLVDAAIDAARRWGAWATHSIASTKHLLATSIDTGLEAQLHLERGLIAAAAGTPDFREGVDAFVHKRRPAFTGTVKAD